MGLAWQDPAYDANGNTTLLPQPKQLDDGYTAVYDAWNRLVKLATDEATPKTVAQYEYDGLNRRAVKKSYTSAGVLDQTRHYYFSDQWQSLEGRLDAATAAERQNVWGARYVDDLGKKRGQGKKRGKKRGRKEKGAVFDDKETVLTPFILRQAAIKPGLNHGSATGDAAEATGRRPPRCRLAPGPAVRAFRLDRAT